MKEFPVKSYRVSVTRTEGDDRGLEFEAVGHGGEEARFAIFVDFEGSIDQAVMSVDPQTPEVPLAVVAWATAYAQSNL